jgi:DEAD/DEAH box helicase domain-containing protein
VKTLDYAQRKAFVRKVDMEYYTDAITSTRVRVLESFTRMETRKCVKEHGEVHVEWKVSGFKKIKFSSRENVGYGPVTLPDQEMHTTAYWFTLKSDFIRATGFSRAQIIDGLLGISYLLHHTAPFLLMCDMHDLSRSMGDRSARWFVQEGAGQKSRYSPSIIGADDGQELALEGLDQFEPTIFLYDCYRGGIGFSPVLYDSHETLLTRSKRVLDNCPCSAGCPSCAGPPEEIGKESKKTALSLLESMVTHEPERTA